jgi:NadR type nicotinamide-nucleotide adenylyltransferase
LIKRIAITGPESSGKSTLAIELAKYFKTVYVPEFARQYLTQLNRPYNYDDIENIAQHQLKMEDELATQANRLLFCDTDMLVNKIWCDVKFGKCHPWIEEAVEKQKYDLFLLCKPDIEWEYDPLREDENNRDQLFEVYKKELQKRKFAYEIISGIERLELALRILNDRRIISNSDINK